MKKMIVLACALLVASAANAQLLWKVSGNGLEKPSYLFGTHHLAPLSVLDKVPGYKEAFNATTQVVGEVDMKKLQSPENMQKVKKLMIISSDTTLQMLFTEKEQEMINDFIKPALGFDLTQAPKLKPAFISAMITIVVARKSLPGYNPNEQLDGYFQTKGEKEGKKIAALETIDFQFKLLYDSQSLQRQARMLVCSLGDTIRVKNQMNMMKELNNAYLSSDLKKMLQLSQERDGTSCDPLPGEFEALTDNRNKDWATKLPAIMKETPSFIAVGALHLPGETGVIALLQKLGYKVEPVK